MGDEFIREYVGKVKNVENEIAALREDLKDIDAEYKDKIDVKAVKAAIRIVKIKKNSDENIVADVIRVLETVET